MGIKIQRLIAIRRAENPNATERNDARYSFPHAQTKRHAKGYRFLKLKNSIFDGSVAVLARVLGIRKWYNSIRINAYEGTRKKRHDIPYGRTGNPIFPRACRRNSERKNFRYSSGFAQTKGHQAKGCFRGLPPITRARLSKMKWLGANQKCCFRGLPPITRARGSAVKTVQKYFNANNSFLFYFMAKKWPHRWKNKLPLLLFGHQSKNGHNAARLEWVGSQQNVFSIRKFPKEFSSQSSFLIEPQMHKTPTDIHMQSTFRRILIILPHQG